MCTQSCTPKIRFAQNREHLQKLSHKSSIAISANFTEKVEDTKLEVNKE